MWTGANTLTSSARPSPMSLSCFDQLANLSAERVFSWLIVAGAHLHGPSHTPVWMMFVMTGFTFSFTSFGLLTRSLASG